jgi:hypothetical protein
VGAETYGIVITSDQVLTNFYTFIIVKKFTIELQSCLVFQSGRWSRSDRKLLGGWEEMGDGNGNGNSKKMLVELEKL